jgi:hypothetical protein
LLAKGYIHAKNQRTNQRTNQLAGVGLLKKMDSRAKSPDKMVDNIDPPELIMFSLGPGLAPAGESIVTELVRLTPLTVFHISTDVTMTDAQWNNFKLAAMTSELPCICLFESTTLNDLCGTHSEENINSRSSSNMEKEEEEKPYPIQWAEKVKDVLIAGHMNKEVVFVVDRSLDAGLKSAPHTSSDVYDCLDYLPHQLLPYFLPLLTTRPLLLLPELARYSAAQCLNRIVALLPDDDTNNKNKSDYNMGGEAPASFVTSPNQAGRRSLSPSSPSNHLISPSSGGGAGGGSSSNEFKKSRESVTTPSSAASNHRNSLRGSVHRGRSSITRRLSAEGMNEAISEAEVASRRASFIRTYMEEKVCLQNQYFHMYIYLFIYYLAFTSCA